MIFFLNGEIIGSNKHKKSICLLIGGKMGWRQRGLGGKKLSAYNGKDLDAVVSMEWEGREGGL